MSSPILTERRAANKVPPAPPPGDAFGVRAAADAVLQHGRLALAVFALVFGAALLYQWLAAPVYRADTVLEIDTRARSSLLPSLSSTERGAALLEPQQVTGEMEVLRSREVLIPVIMATGADLQVSGGRRFGFLPVGSRHGLDVVWFQVPDSQRGIDFAVRAENGLWELSGVDGKPLASGQLGEARQFKIADGEGWVVVAGPKDLPRIDLTVRAENLLKAHENVLTRLRLFEPSRDSNVLRLSFEDTRPARAAALLNYLATHYLTQTVKRRSAESEKALAYLENQLPALKARVTAAEDGIRRLQTRGSAAPFSTEAEAALRQRGDLERQQVELRIRRDLLAQTLTPDHPDLGAVMAQLDTVQRAINRLQGSVNQFPGQQRDLLPLQRELQVSTQLYTAMLTHVQTLRIQTASGLPTARQLDMAADPVEPARPRASAVLSIGAGLGLLMSLLSVLVVRALQPTVSDVYEFETFTSPPTLGVIPESDTQLRLMDTRLKEGAVDELGTHRLLVRAAPEDPAVESLRSVHLSLMLRMRSNECKVILITSPSPGTGKAFIAANLAALMADAGKRVLLIESDLRKPGLHKFVGLDEHAPGLTDILSGRRALDEVIRSHVAVEMDVILQGTNTGNPGGILLSPELEHTLVDLRQRYDHIVIHAAPLLPSGDAVAIGRLADAALLVVRAEQSLLRETRVAQRRLEQAGIKLEGILVNGVKRNRLNAPRLT